MNRFTDFHNESVNYALSRIKDKITGNKLREAQYLRGNIQPKWEPQGSFTRMPYLNDNGYVENEPMDGGGLSYRTQEGHNWASEQLKKRGNQIAEMSGLVDDPLTPERTETRKETLNNAGDKETLELFFNELVSNNFTNTEYNTESIKRIFTILRRSGIDLNLTTLKRFSNILDENLRQYLDNLIENRDLNLRTAINKIEVDDDPDVSNYLNNLSNLPDFEFLYKIYLILESLINSYNLGEQERKQNFNSQYQDIIKARPSNLYTGKIKNMVELSKDRIKQLKDLIPSNFYTALFNKKRNIFDDLKNIEGQVAEKPEKRTKQGKVKNASNVKGELTKQMKKDAVDLIKATNEDFDYPLNPEDLEILKSYILDDIKRVYEEERNKLDNITFTQRNIKKTLSDIRQIINDGINELQETAGQEERKEGEEEGQEIDL
tara:strand:+ start:2600 stop:3901 length:1302 start_codon:yes stop_codon:yes gene_type:complete